MTTSQQKPPAPLAGVRVIEMGRLIAAPFCAQILGDLGADVIKIERAGAGDDVRNYGPPFLQGHSTMGASAYYLGGNRNKRSVGIDFAQPEGAELIRRLVGKSDVFIENFKVGGLTKYGLDQESLRKANEELIYLSVSGFGQTGPYAHRPATDVVIQGMSGLMSVCGEADGDPQKIGVPMADMVTGLYGAVGVISALYERVLKKRGGNWVGVSLLDSALSTMNAAHAWSQMMGKPYLRSGNGSFENAPSGMFTCKDGGEIMFQAGKDADFVKLCKVLKTEHLLDNPRFAKRPQRVENRFEMKEILQAVVSEWDRPALFDALMEAGIICGPINNVNNAMAEPQVKVNGAAQLANHPDDPSLELIGSPIRFSEGAPEITRYPPRVGEHTESALAEVLGMSAAEVDALEEKRVVSRWRGYPG